MHFTLKFSSDAVIHVLHLQNLIIFSVKCHSTTPNLKNGVRKSVKLDIFLLKLLRLINLSKSVVVSVNSFIVWR